MATLNVISKLIYRHPVEGSFGSEFPAIWLVSAAVMLPCLLIAAENQSVRPAAKVSEAKGANTMGTTILIVSFLPIGVLVSMDLLKLVWWAKDRGKPRPPKRKHRI